MAHRLLAVVSIAAAGCVARDMSYLNRIVPYDRDLPPGCEALGQVSSGEFTGEQEEARYRVWKEAEKLGATHVHLGIMQWYHTREGPPSFRVPGTAYRCPASPQPRPEAAPRAPPP
jgi:hypothetical protein